MPDNLTIEELLAPLKLAPRYPDTTTCRYCRSKIYQPETAYIHQDDPDDSQPICWNCGSGIMLENGQVDPADPDIDHPWRLADVPDPFRCLRQAIIEGRIIPPGTESNDQASTQVPSARVHRQVSPIFPP
jgi:hypothetical protein